MARKGGLSEFLDVAAKLPWKVSVALAPISYLVLHIIAAASVQSSTVTDLRQMGTVVLRGYIHTFSSLLQYIIPFALLLGAAISFLKQSRSIKLYDEVRGDSPARVANLSWQEFERLVGEAFRRRGFAVRERGGAAPDGGVDLLLVRGSEHFLVQCKQWRAQQVGVSVVRELYGVMAAERAAGGYVVTSGTFTKDATKFSAGRNIELMDGKGLAALLSEVRPVTVKPIDTMPALGGKFTPAAPDCPNCKTPMVLRTAKQGSGKGNSFWGCAQFPKCRQTMSMG